MGRLLVVDWAPSEREGDKVLFVFDGGPLTAEQLDTITLPPDELEASEFHDAADLHAVMIERLARRIQAAINGSAPARRVTSSTAGNPAHAIHG